jgi:hypothetical protein
MHFPVHPAGPRNSVGRDAGPGPTGSRGGSPLEPGRFIMRKQSDQHPKPSATLAVLFTLFYRTCCGGKHDVVQRG